MEQQNQLEFMRFLQDDLAVPPAAISLALQYADQTLNLLPIILWQYGLVSILQLNQMLDWLEFNTVSQFPLDL